MLALGPDDHLVGPSQGEQTNRQTAGHDGEGDPGTYFIGIVRTRDQALHLGERVGVGVGNLPLLGACWTQVS